jgi:ketosteroid isomerase-like protein
MPDRERVNAFIATVVSGKHVEAIAEFYHEDSSMQENDQPPRLGRDLLIQHETESLKKVQRINTHPVQTYLIDGDSVVIRWTFDIVDRAGALRRLEELSLQRWRGDRIAEERFFYDSASAWRIVE